jgi:DNA-binding MarR family transcriptional regulator
MSDKALRMLKHMRRQIFGHPAPYVEVRGAAISIGVDPGGIECEGLVDELLQAGYIQSYPSPSLAAHGLYRLTDQGIAAAREAAAEEG